MDCLKKHKKRKFFVIYVPVVADTMIRVSCLGKAALI